MQLEPLMVFNMPAEVKLWEVKANFWCLAWSEPASYSPSCPNPCCSDMATPVAGAWHFHCQNKAQVAVLSSTQGDRARAMHGQRGYLARQANLTFALRAPAWDDGICAATKLKSNQEEEIARL